MDVSIELCLNLVLAAVLIAIVAYYHRSSTSKSATTSTGKSTSTSASGVGNATGGSSSSSAASKPSASLQQRSAASAGQSKNSERADDGKQSAATSLARAAADKSKEEYFGLIKRYSERNGMGFIICEPVKRKYTVDVRIFREEYEPAQLSVGDAVAFHIVLGGRTMCREGHPWATEVRLITDPAELATAKTCGDCTAASADVDTGADT